MHKFKIIIFFCKHIRMVAITVQAYKNAKVGKRERVILGKND